jgi:ribosomal protein S18 acetylase RimI-like enzyme
MPDEIHILTYHPSYQPHFERLNKVWIEKYFRLEPIDIEVLEHPEPHIIDPGGQILFAAIGQQIVGTVAIRKIDEQTVEMTKMAVDEAYQGRKIGWVLGQAIIQTAKDMGFSKMVLYSNTDLVPAIQLYRKMGFKEVPVEPGKYDRCDIQMEMDLSTNAVD